MKLTTPKNIQSVSLYNKRYDKFRGVDFSTDPTQVNDSRSPICQNLISDLAGFPEKRTGWRTLHELTDKINGLFVFGEVIVCHAGAKLYVLTDTTSELIYSYMNDAKSVSFTHGGKLYILDGIDYRVVTKIGAAYSLSSVTGFVPTTVIGAAPTGAGTAFEAVNLITPRRKNSFIGNGSATVFQLDSTHLDRVHLVSVAGVVKDAADYTIDLEAGTVTFDTAPADGSGVDNVVIEFSKTVSGYGDRIKKCTIYASYGFNNDNRVFLSGNPDYPNVDWQSGLDDPTYFPDTGYTKIGSDSSAIMGYLKQGDGLAIIKEQSSQDSEIYLRTAAMTDTTVYFPVKQGLSGLGAISKYCFANLRDDPLFLTRDGVYALVSTSVTQEKSLQDRSYYVNAQLTREADLSDAVAAVWNGYYVLCVNDTCYVADRRQQTGKSQTEQYSYEWYYWTNIPAVVLMETNGELYFGTSDGKVCKFNSDLNIGSQYNNDGAAIVARWSTKAEDFGHITRKKTLTKKGCGVMIKPYARSSVKVYVATDWFQKTLVQSGNMDLFDFGDIDFSRFTFNTLDTPQVVALNSKVKKFIVIQLILENDEINEGFGVYGIQVQYAIGNYVK